MFNVTPFPGSADAKGRYGLNWVFREYSIWNILSLIAAREANCQMITRLLNLINKLFSKSSQEISQGKALKASDGQKVKLPMHINIGQELGFNLLARVHTGSGNQVVSPLSLSLALGLFSEAATMEAKEEIVESLEIEPYLSNYDSSVAELLKHIHGRLTPRTSQTILSIANGLFVRDELVGLDELTGLMEDIQGSKIEKVDFSNSSAVEKINDWVRDATNGKIASILDRTDARDNCYLINAIYLLASWSLPFEEGDTVEEEFNLLDNTKSRVQKMKQLARFNYFEDRSVQLIELTYKRNELSMFVMMPRKVEAFHELVKSLDKDSFLEKLSKLKKEKVRLSLPKFKIEADIDLVEPLKELGFTGIFSSSQKNSSQQKKSLWVSKIIQKCFVDVNESGTEAAAVTAIGETYAEPGKKKKRKIFEMDVNRPFVFAIRHNATNGFLFLGSVIKP